MYHSVKDMLNSSNTRWSLCGTERSHVVFSQAEEWRQRCRIRWLRVNSSTADLCEDGHARTQVRSAESHQKLRPWWRQLSRPNIQGQGIYRDWEGKSIPVLKANRMLSTKTSNRRKCKNGYEKPRTGFLIPAQEHKLQWVWSQWTLWPSI